jgi:hypothetical protein
VSHIDPIHIFDRWEWHWGGNFCNFCRHQWNNILIMSSTICVFLVRFWNIWRLTVGVR